MLRRNVLLRWPLSRPETSVLARECECSFFHSEPEGLGGGSSPTHLSTAAAAAAASRSSSPSWLCSWMRRRSPPIASNALIDDALLTTLALLAGGLTLARDALRCSLEPPAGSASAVELEAISCARHS